eukprot:CAMPEP_0168467284 /NCGR_PEP_ID=MMETSP0228-20121227/57103_1 /TAXON_ID=133427 /ORGANISM="Protoceratium reticulatum, Strain CCCM 535 (=CCMP 1889)" /LENGTH=60 /DNA_ID=CAMNT_0008482989 /DNA_START=22 /DNA_END=200 /DNA_ORIENTATION=+
MSLEELQETLSIAILQEMLTPKSRDDEHETGWQWFIGEDGRWHRRVFYGTPQPLGARCEP